MSYAPAKTYITIVPSDRLFAHTFFNYTSLSGVSDLRLRHFLACRGLPYAATKKAFRQSLIRAVTTPRYRELWMRHLGLTN